jgi:hypothetical protein
MAYLPVHALMALDGSLPTQAVSEKTYLQTVEAGYLASKEVVSSETDRYQKGRLSGLIGELSVLGLLQREAVRGDGSWYPFPAHISQDKRNRHGSTSNHAWDVSVYYSENGQTLLGPKIQVKSTFDSFVEHQGNMTDCDRNIAMVCVDPDLRLDEYERWINTNIAKELHVELGDYSSSIISQRLESRKDLLYAKLAA